MKSKIRIKVIEDADFKNYIYDAIITKNKIAYFEEIANHQVKTVIDLQNPAIIKSGYINYQMPLKVNLYQRLEYNIDGFLIVYDYYTKDIIIEDGYIKFEYNIIIDDLKSKRTIIINY